MSKYHLYDGSVVELPTHSILLDLDVLTKVVYQQPRRRIGRIITAIVSWFNGDLSPINLTEVEWYTASILYRSASESLTKYQNRLKPATVEEIEDLSDAVRQKPSSDELSFKLVDTEDEEERKREMVREVRKAYRIRTSPDNTL